MRRVSFEGVWVMMSVDAKIGRQSCPKQGGVSQVGRIPMLLLTYPAIYMCLFHVRY